MKYLHTLRTMIYNAIWRLKYKYSDTTTLTEHVTGTAGDGVPAEIEYRDEKGTVVGFWAYGYFHPDYPFQG